MGEIIVKAYAKLNLSLNVIGRRSDGYHNVEMVMQTIDLHDTITIRQNKTEESSIIGAGEGINVTCDSLSIPSGEDNIAYKAAMEMYKRYNLGGSLEIQITKRIPSSAGLAGGSADAAAVIRGINLLFGLKADIKELAEVGVKIGADVPFCIYGGTMLAEGLGELLSPISSFEGIDVVLIKPDINISTPWAYRNLDLTNLKDIPNTQKMIEHIKNNDITGVARNMKNVFESVVSRDYKEIEALKDSLMRNGAIGSMMSGSGSTVFGIFNSELQAQCAYDKLKAIYIKGEQLFLAKTVRGEGYGR